MLPLERIDGDTNQLLGILIAVSWDDWRLSIAICLFVIAAVTLLFRLHSFGVPFNAHLN